jgi:hypothetical protein
MATSKTCNDLPVVKKIDSCDQCDYTSSTLDLPIKTEERTIVMQLDTCAVQCPPVVTPTIYECAKTVTLTQNFTRNNCAPTDISGSIDYTATATVTAYSTLSDADACTKATVLATQAAQKDINTNGQGYANTNASCTPTVVAPCTYVIAVNAVSVCETAQTACTYGIALMVNSECEPDCTYVIDLDIDEVCE